MLMNERDAMLAQSLRPDWQGHAPAVDDNGGLAIGFMEIGKDLDQNRLTRPVLAKKTMDLAVVNRQIDFIECFDAAEALREPLDPQNVTSGRPTGIIVRRGR